MRSNSAKQLLNITNSETWVVVSNRTEAIVYHDGRDQKFHFVERLKNPEGQLTESELDSAPQGRGVSSAGHGTIHHALGGRNTRHEATAKKFATTIAQFLETARRSERYGQLILAAEPHFLGLLRGALSEPVRGAVTHEIPREYVDGSDAEIRSRVHSAIASREK